MARDQHRLRWGLIGCGDIARKRVAPALRDSRFSEIHCVNRANPDLLASTAKEFGAKSWVTDWHELVADGELDAVYVATPVHLHAEQTIAALHAGKHVLCEKPMALNFAECDRMISAANANNKKLGIAYYRHFYPVLKRVKELIESGEIGAPVVAQMNAFEWFNPPPAHPRAWLLQKQLSGGGPMIDFGCHRIEVLLNLFGPISKVKAITSRVLFEREVEDTALAVFEFGEGTVASLTVTHAAREAQDTLMIWGSHGSIQLPKLNEGKLFIKSGAGERSELHPPAANIHQPLIEDFIGAVCDDRRPEVDGEIGRAVAKVIEDIYLTAS